MPRADKSGNYHHGDLRQAVINSALELIAERDIQSLTLREIAKRVGVSQMAPYRHFKNKAVLLAVLAQEGFQSLYDHLQEALAKSSLESLPNPVEKVKVVGVAYILFAVENPVHYRVMFDASLSNRTVYPPLYQTAVKVLELCMQIVIECQQAGLIDERDPKELAQIKWSTCHGLSMLLIDHQFSTMGHAPVEELANSTLKTLVEGLRKQCI